MVLERCRMIILVDRSGRAKDHQDRSGKTQLSECTVFHYDRNVVVAWKRSPVAVPGRDRRFRQSHPIVSCSPCHVHHKSVGGRLLKTRPWPATRKRHNLPHPRVHQTGGYDVAYSLTLTNHATSAMHEHAVDKLGLHWLGRRARLRALRLCHSAAGAPWHSRSAP